MVVHLSVVAWPLREYPAGTTGTTRAAWKEWTPPPLPFFLLRQCAVSSYAGSLPLPSSVQACFLTLTLSDVLAHLLAIVRVDHGGQTVIGMPHMTNRPVDMHHSPAACFFGLRRAPEFDFSAAGDHRVLSAPSSRLRVTQTLSLISKTKQI